MKIKVLIKHRFVIIMKALVITYLQRQQRELPPVLQLTALLELLQGSLACRSEPRHLYQLHVASLGLIIWKSTENNSFKLLKKKCSAPRKDDEIASILHK